MIQRRYCVVRDATLFIYKDKDDLVLLKMIFLRGLQIYSNVKDLDPSRDCEKLTIGNVDYYYLSIEYDNIQ